MNMTDEIKSIPIDTIIFRINELPYVVSNDPPERDDVIIDIRDYTWGVHGGEFGGRIAHKSDGGRTGFTAVVEGVEKQYIRKLVIKTI